MTNEERKKRDEYIRLEIEDHLEKAKEVIETSRGYGETRALFIVFVDSAKASVRTIGHSLAIDAALHTASEYILKHQLLPPKD